MALVFFILAALTIVSAMAAMSFRNLIHCALSLIVTFAGLACLYLQLHAQFVGIVQVLIYIGAVGILIVFAVLLTRNSTSTANAGAPFWTVGPAIALLVLGALWYAISKSELPTKTAPPAPEITVNNIGTELMTRYVLPMEVIGLLLTAAMLGAVIIAMNDRRHASVTPKRETQAPAQLRAAEETVR